MNLDTLAGKTTAIAGLEKSSGKTTFLNFLATRLRPEGPLGIFTIGMDGSQKAPGLRDAPIDVKTGDVVITTEPFARSASARLELLEALPGKSALGALLLGRVRREGAVTLVGCEHLGVLSDCIHRVRQAGWTHTVLIDGAVHRMTQVQALTQSPEGGYLMTLQAEPATLQKVARRVKTLARLAVLPVTEASKPNYRLDGPLTETVLSQLPVDITHLSLEDLTKVFLEDATLARLLDRCQLSVRQPLRLHGFVAVLRNLSRVAFQKAVGLDEGMLYFNPFEVA